MATKKRVGRPKLNPSERRRAIEITLPPETIELARKIGVSVSRGVELALHFYARECGLTVPRRQR